MISYASEHGRNMILKVAGKKKNKEFSLAQPKEQETHGVTT
jgi:hypothetical protein